ncbi:MAG: hypothetical protein Q7S45_00370 [Candidatus Curtissbacteria bacterium]|nr:hypothetical protein [Candidatus Curtissbacteria bacterium]
MQELPPPNISPEVLTALGLDGDIERPYLEQMRKKGRSHYTWRRVSRDKTTFTLSVMDWYVKFSIDRKEQIPVTLLDRWRQSALGFEPEVRSLIEKGVRVYVEGFTEQALDEKQFVSATEMFDSITPGGITQNLEVMSRLKSEAASFVSNGNPLRGLEIARAIQNIVNSKQLISS